MEYVLFHPAVVVENPRVLEEQTRPVNLARVVLPFVLSVVLRPRLTAIIRPSFVTQLNAPIR